MMLKITQRCTMGCTHCLNNAMPNGIDMTDETLLDALYFLKANDLGEFHLVISGGEPTEHRNFDYMMNIILNYIKLTKYFKYIVITTNGENIQNNPEQYLNYVKEFKEAGCELVFQVSADVRYYPRRIQTHKRIFREEGFVLCDNCIQSIYPQGRALENNIPSNRISSHCFNVRALSKQGMDTLSKIEMALMTSQKYCTPHISVHGEIKLGESDLCPSCATIYDSDEEIIEKIQKFKCSKCDHINKNLDPKFKKFL